MLRVVPIAFLITTAALAEPAGPPRPTEPKRTPAEQAIALYGEDRAAPCAPVRGSDITVCGNGRSPYRLPLPDERGPHRSIGEAARADAGGAPVGHAGMAGVTVDVLALAGAVTGTGPSDAKIVTPGDAKPPH